MSAEIVAASVEIGLAVLREAPAGLGRMSNWIRGRRILVLGAASSGKTSLLKYLEYGVLLPEGEQTPSHGWGVRGDQTYQKTRDFIIKAGRDDALKLRVRTAIDVVGQLSPSFHAKLVSKHRPHALVVMTDSSVRLSGPESSGRWLRDFAEEVAGELQNDGHVRRLLKSIVVVMNKADRSTESHLQQRAKHFRVILKRALDGKLRFRTSTIPILQCVLVENADGGKFADAVIKRVALKLSERI
jgi:hypothetical protein